MKADELASPLPDPTEYPWETYSYIEITTIPAEIDLDAPFPQKVQVGHAETIHLKKRRTWYTKGDDFFSIVGWEQISP